MQALPALPSYRSCPPGPGGSVAAKGLVPSGALGAGQPPWVLCRQRAGGAAVAAFGRKASASRSSRCLNGRARRSRIAPRGFYSFASLSPQMYSLLPLPLSLFVQLLSWTIFHALLTAIAFMARVSLAAS